MEEEKKSSPTCCECGVIVGSAGASRACLLLPCQHVLHARCVEFLQRQWLLRHPHRQLLISSAEGEAAAFAKARLHCPGCHQFVQRVIPLFLGDSVECEGELNGGGASSPSPSSSSTSPTPVSDERLQTREVLQAQSAYLTETEAWTREQQAFEDLTKRCSALHLRKLELGRELSQCLRLLPTAVLDTPSGVIGSATALQHCGEEELQMFVSHCTASLHQLQQKLRECETSCRRKRRRYEYIKMKYAKARGVRVTTLHEEKMDEKEDLNPRSLLPTAASPSTEERASATQAGSSSLHPRPHHVEEFSHRLQLQKGLLIIDAENKGEEEDDEIGEEEEESWRIQKRRRSRPCNVLDVDATQSNEGGEDVVTVEDSEVDVDDRVVVVVEGEEGEVVEEESLSYFPSSTSSSSAVFVSGAASPSPEESHTTESKEDEDDESGRVVGFLPPRCLLHKPTPIQMRHVENLPRREGWQMTLSSSS